MNRPASGGGPRPYLGQLKAQHKSFGQGLPKNLPRNNGVLCREDNEQLVNTVFLWMCLRHCETYEIERPLSAKSSLKTGQELGKGQALGPEYAMVLGWL